MILWSNFSFRSGRSLY